MSVTISLPLPHHEKLAIPPRMVADLADAGLHDDDIVIEADDGAAGIDQMIVLEHSYGSVLLGSLFEIPVGL